MANLKLDNLSSSVDYLLNQNIVVQSNNLKNYYSNSNVLKTLELNGNVQALNLKNEIQAELNSLSDKLNDFSVFFNQYINDYISVNKYLSSGSHSGVSSVPTFDLLKSSPSLKSDSLNDVSVVNYEVALNYNNVIKNGSKKDIEEGRIHE